MSYSLIREFDELRQALSGLRASAAVWKVFASRVRELKGVDQVVLHHPTEGHLDEPAGEFSDRYFERLFIGFGERGVRLGTDSIDDPVFMSHASEKRLPQGLVQSWKRSGVRSGALVCLFRDGVAWRALECRFYRSEHIWSSEDRLWWLHAAELLSSHLARCASQIKGAAPTSLSYGRVAELGNMMIIRTDPKFTVKEVYGGTEKILGITAGEMLHDPSVWIRFVHGGDLRRLLLRSRRDRLTELSDEVRVINRKTGRTHWLLLRAAPRYSSDNVFIGWEGFGVDITDRRSAQEELVLQGRRIEALYEVSRSLQANVDPAIVMLRALRALTRATKSDGGLGYLYDFATRTHEIVAAEGVSSEFISTISSPENSQGLFAQVLAKREGMVLEELESLPEAKVLRVEKEGVRSAIIMPLVFEESVLGIIVLLRRRSSRYSEADFDLVKAASSQIALAAREAELYATEKQQSNSLAALYRLSHELSKQVTLREVIEHAFPIIQEELGCKRLWLGVLDDRGGHIVGQAGTGPGMRKEIVELQVDLSVRRPLLEKALSGKQAVVVENPESADCGDLGKVLKKLQCGPFAIVPLVALGQVVGVLIVEPTVPSAFFSQRKLPLLNSMASEIAPVILARRFESRMADAEKMRMAGLLASGIAHNFNNLLQAVMGQASLIEMQAAHDSRLSSSARLIIEAAGRGAGLVKQLFAFSTQGGYSPRRLSIMQLLQDSRDLYRSVIGPEIELQIEEASDVPEVFGDYSRLQQAITNLIVNAKEAIATRTSRLSEGLIRIRIQAARVRSGEIGPELSPGRYVRLDVEDNGAGMDQDTLTRCFEPFFTTKNADNRTGLGFSGSGLGLSSAYSIVRQHDGLITARSRPEQGASFSIYLPAQPSPEKQAEGDGPALGIESDVEAFLVGISPSDAVPVRSALESLGIRVSGPLSVDAFLHKAKGLKSQLLQRDQNKPGRYLLVVDADREGSRLGIVLEEGRALSGGAILIGMCDSRSTLGEGAPGIRPLQKTSDSWSLLAAFRKFLCEGVSERLADRIEVEIEQSGPKSTEGENAVAELAMELKDEEN